MVYVRLFLRTEVKRIDFDVNVHPHPTVGDLRSRAVKRLGRPEYFVSGSPLQGARLIVFRNDDESTTELGDTVGLTAKANYTALELFSTVPIDLFRRVPPSKIHPAVESQPGNQLSKRSPLFCASFREDEYRATPYEKNRKQGNVECDGISLGYNLEDDRQFAVAGGDKYPWVDMDETDQKGRVSLQLEGDDSFTPATSNWGYLHNSPMTRQDGPDFLATVPDKRTQSAEGPVRKRSTYYRFKLPQGTDLAAHGVAVVFDSYNHFVLICAAQPHYRLWVETAPSTYSSQGEPVPVPESNGPKQFHGETYQVILPAVAALFELHDLLVVAA